VADLDRISEVTGIPFHFPQEFPVLTVLPMRVLTALQIHEADKYEQCMDKVRQTFFSLSACSGSVHGTSGTDDQLKKKKKSCQGIAFQGAMATDDSITPEKDKAGAK